VTRPVGELLRQWRDRRRLSQLELAIRADISTRHLSFVETGRSAPSRSMLLHLADELDIPLRERNRMLLAAGFAPVYPETTVDSPALGPLRAGLHKVLAAHEPFPAVVLDSRWNLVDANASAALFTEGAANHLLEPPLNVMRISLHPDGLARNIVNLAPWRAHQLDRLRRQIAVTADESLAALYEELCSYGDSPVEDSLPAPGDLALPLRIRHRGQELSFVTIVATFGTPYDVTVSELMIESFLPADEATAAFLATL
jgi:transcriptional regulator with XRE-family HTH domain